MRLVSLFRRVERAAQLTKYWAKCVKARLVQRWAELAGAGAGHQGALSLLQQFYPELADEAAQQRAWVAEVFPEEEPGQLVCGLLTDCLAALEPSPAFCVQADLKLAEKEGGEAGLELLLQVRAATEHLMTSCEAGVAGTGQGRLRELGREVWRPLAGPLGRYEELEGGRLEREVRSWAGDTKRDTIEELQALTGAAPRLPALLLAATVRCHDLSRHTACPALTRAAARAVAAHLERYSEYKR